MDVAVLLGLLIFKKREKKFAGFALKGMGTLRVHASCLFSG